MSEISADRIKRALTVLRRRSADLPGGVFMGVPAEAFARDDLLRFVSMAMAEIKQLRRRDYKAAARDHLT